MSLPREDYERGDIVFCTNRGILPAAIRHAQRRAHERHWDINHVAVLNGRLHSVVRGHNDWSIYQAQPHGVTDSEPLSTIAPQGRHFVLPFPNDRADLTKFLHFIESAVGDHYGWTTIFSDALNMLLPPTIIFRRGGTYDCSGLVACALVYAGFEPLIRSKDFYSTTPAEIAEKLLHR